MKLTYTKPQRKLCNVLGQFPQKQRLRAIVLYKWLTEQVLSVEGD